MGSLAASLERSLLKDPKAWLASCRWHGPQLVMHVPAVVYCRTCGNPCTRVENSFVVRDPAPGC